MSMPLDLKIHTVLNRYGVPAAYGFLAVAFSFIFYAWLTSAAYGLAMSFLHISMAIVLYARFIEPRWLHVRHINLALTNTAITKPITIALIADLHASQYKRSDWTARIVKEVLAGKPDVVLIAGDLINNQFPPDAEVDYLNPLSELAHLPVFYVLGNHDYGTGRPQVYCFEDRSEDVIKKMEELGIPLLKNSLEEIVVRGQKIALFGCDDIWSRTEDYSALEKKWDKETPLLFVTHNPDAVMTWPEHLPKPAYAFGGHSHGGQFALLGMPLGSATMRLGRKCYRGAHVYNGLPFYVSPGLGESTIPFRFGVRPELPFLTLSPKKAI